MAQQVLSDVVRGLDPVSAAGGLLPAVQRLADEAGASCSFAEVPNLSPAQDAVVFYTCAEGLANATKHAPGAAVDLQLENAGSTYVLTVRDDGPGGADLVGSGLIGLRERAATVGGRLSVDSPTGTGTTLRLVLPAGTDRLSKGEA